MNLTQFLPLLASIGVSMIPGGAPFAPIAGAAVGALTGGHGGGTAPPLANAMPAKPPPPPFDIRPGADPQMDPMGKLGTPPPGAANPTPSNMGGLLQLLGGGLTGGPGGALGGNMPLGMLPALLGQGGGPAQLSPLLSLLSSNSPLGLGRLGF